MDKELREKILTPASYVEFKTAVRRRYYFGNTVKQLESRIASGDSDIMSYVLPETELYRYVSKSRQKCYALAVSVRDISEYYKGNTPALNTNSDGDNNDV